MRRGKYFLGFDMSREVGVAVTHIWWLRIAQALGLPVVPEVKIRAERSRGVALAGGEIVVGAVRLEVVRRVIEGFGCGKASKEDRLRVKCCLDPSMNPARSRVEMIV